MNSFSHGQISQQFRFLRQKFPHDGKLPFTNGLAVETATHALEKIAARRKDRIETLLVTLWSILGKVVSADHSCRDAFARPITNLISPGNSQHHKGICSSPRRRQTRGD